MYQLPSHSIGDASVNEQLGASNYESFIVAWQSKEQRAAWL